MFIVRLKPMRYHRILPLKNTFVFLKLGFSSKTNCFFLTKVSSLFFRMKPCHPMKKRVFLSTNSPWCYRMWVTIQLANTCAWQPMMQAKGPASKCFWTSNVSNTARVSSWLDSDNNAIGVLGIQQCTFL